MTVETNPSIPPSLPLALSSQFQPFPAPSSPFFSLLSAPPSPFQPFNIIPASFQCLPFLSIPFQSSIFQSFPTPSRPFFSPFNLLPVPSIPFLSYFQPLSVPILAPSTLLPLSINFQSISSPFSAPFSLSQPFPVPSISFQPFPALPVFSLLPVFSKSGRVPSPVLFSLFLLFSRLFQLLPAPFPTLSSTFHSLNSGSRPFPAHSSPLPDSF